MRKIILAITMLNAVYQAFANDEDTTVVLQQVVVTANKIEVRRNAIPLTVSVIERDEIEASSESALLPVLSQRVPGLFLTEKGIAGFGVNTNSAGTVNVRGIGQGNKVLMLFDGQPQWAGIFGHSLPDSYVASDVERVEVIRGPGSLLYGSNAMGGVVNIITRRQLEDGRHSQARLMFGSYNTQKYMINNGFNTGCFSSFVSLNHDRSDGFRANSAFRITNGFANLGYSLNEHLQIKSNTSIAKSKSQNSGALDNPITDNTMDVLRGSASLALTNAYKKSSGAVQLFYNWGHHEINNGYRPQNNQLPSAFRFKSDDHNAGVLLYQNFRLFDGNSITAGVDYKNWGGHAWNDTINGQRGELVNRSVNELAGYTVVQQDFFDRLNLNLGARYEYNDAYGSRLTPQAGLTLQTFAGNTVKLSFSEGYRSPNIRELYISYPPYSVANPNLKPETLQNYELSFAQQLFDNRLSAEITAFYLEANNLIAAVEGTLTNVNRLYNHGFEAELTCSPMKNLRIIANYSRLFNSAPLEAAPESKLFAEATFSIKRLTLASNIESIGRLQKVGGTNDDIISYSLLNAKASYLFGTHAKGVALFVKGENLTGKKYEILKGFPMPAATVMGGVNFNF